MYNLKIQGHAKTVLIAAWLKKQKWKFDLKVQHNNPFSDEYHLILNDKQQAFMTQLQWGIA